MQIDDGILVLPFPEDDEDYRGCGYQRENHDEVRFEPIVALALVEDNLQGSEAKGNETETDVIDFGFAELAALEIRRILNKPRSQQKGENPDGNVDEKNPAPGEVVGDPAAERGADRRSAHHCDAVNGKGHATLGGWKSIGEDGLLAGLQTASSSTLQHAAND